MPNDWTTDKAEIPPDAERQDFTLDKVGFARNHKPSDDDVTRLVVRAVVDNGEYQGFQVSTAFEMPDVNPDLKAFLDGAGVADTDFMGDVLNAERVVRTLRDHHTKYTRFSARLHVTEKETDSERLVTYRLGQFDAPEEEATLNLHSEPTQFNRDV